jgi:ankyrin repeat protein
MVASPPVADPASPIMDALYHGRTAEADQMLTDAGAESLTIHEAAAMGAVGRLRHLLDDEPAAANAWSADGFQPLGLAAFFGRREAVELLLARGGEVNTHARHQFHVAALHAALAGPQPSIARLLVDAGADVNARQQAGVTPLHETAHNGDLELTQLLLDHGADPLVTDDQGQTPAATAREHGHEAVAILLEKAALTGPEPVRVGLPDQT